MSALRKHCEFFDLDKDGILTPLHTFQAFYSLLQYNLFMSLLGTALVHIFFSYATQPTWFPDPFFSIHLNAIQRCRHGSDSGIYDINGNFDANRFMAITSLFCKATPGWMFGDAGAANVMAVNFWDGFRMTEAFRETFDFFGWIAAKIEWFFLFALVSKHGWVRVEDIKSMYDGSLFERIAKKNK